MRDCGETHMNRCLITYEPVSVGTHYSARGLKLLSPQLKNLRSLPYDASEQRMLAAERAGKMSIQGVQDKLSANLKVKNECFEIVDHNGRYILKPQSHHYPELPENEAITMSLAERIGIEVATHGLVYSKDRSLTYFIKRFDRFGHNKKLAQEDFAQLSGLDRNTKYQSSIEKVIKLVAGYCTFPKIEYVKIFKLVLFSFLVGNEDMHLKNFSLITRNGTVALSPAYDLLNSTITLSNTKEELALPLHGKKSNLNKNDFFKYFAAELLQLNDKVIQEISQQLRQAIPHWQALIDCSFLSKRMQNRYLALLEQRAHRLGLL